VIYTFTATNNGTSPLTGVAITDPLSGLSALTYGSWPSGTSGTLQPGQAVTATATYTLTQTDVDAGSIVNQATVVGNPPTGAPVTGGRQPHHTHSVLAGRPPDRRPRLRPRRPVRRGRG
ncbi:DUF11 domain-containing protein, partial [Bacillus sp. S34]|nr:DUF11 domain-containing protein [Bacillus sp. S34]